MLARLTLLVALGLAACLEEDEGYYWWDETNDVWCFTYDDDGTTQCDDATDTRSISCSDGADGTRHCEVYDSGYLCVFEYAADGTMTPGTCVLIDADADSLVRRDCQPANDGTLICQFENATGEHCVVIFDTSGTVTYDPCGYFAPPAAP